jgi:hypothetical protein
MQSPFQNMIKNFKEKNKQNSDDESNILYSVDLSANNILPNTILFNNAEFDEKNGESRINVLKKVKTNEKFYGNGILGNIYNLKHVTRNWLLGLCMIKQYHHLFDTDINCFYMGVGKHEFHKGLKYFLACKNSYQQNNIQWLGMDNSCELYEKLSGGKKSPRMISGFNGNDLTCINNILHIKNIIECKFSNVNLLCNFIKPCNEKENILLGVAILSMSVLNKNGLMISRIKSPKVWGNSMNNMLLLFIMIFDTVKICKYPIQKGDNMKYSYYLICHKIKQTTYNSLIYRKLINQFKKNKPWNFLDNIYKPDVMDILTKIRDVNLDVLGELNAQDELNDIIMKLKHELNRNIISNE